MDGSEPPSPWFLPPPTRPSIQSLKGVGGHRPVEAPGSSSDPTSHLCSCSVAEYDTENMNAEEIYSSLRGVTEAIQSFSYRSQEDLNEPLRRDGKRDDAVSPSPDTVDYQEAAELC